MSPAPLTLSRHCQSPAHAARAAALLPRRPSSPCWSPGTPSWRHGAAGVARHHWQGTRPFRFRVSSVPSAGWLTPSATKTPPNDQPIRVSSPPPPPVARAPCSAPSIRDSHSQRPRRTVVRASTLVYTLYGRGLPDAAARGGYPAAVRASAFRESPAGCGAPRGREACRGWRGRCPVVQARTCAGGIRQPVRAAHR